MNSEAILDLQDVSVPSRRDAEAVSISQVTWAVDTHDFWIVGGPHGAGKSDLIFMLAGLTKPLTGCYKLFGYDMGQHFGDEFLPSRLRIGMVFDDSRLLSNLTFAENVALPARYHHNLHADEAWSWAEVLLRAVDAAEFAHSKPSAVARPWRQRAALARALALKPEVLLFENPLRGMDTRHTAWWVNFIEKLARGHDVLAGKPMTIIASTDEFRPWRHSQAQFASLREQSFQLHDGAPPEDETRMARVATGEGT